MAEVEGQRYVCKICSKSCVSGKSLGGHMRIHLAVIAASKKAAQEKAEIKMEFDDDDDQSNSDENVKNCDELGDGDDQNSTYVLRENPKKSWRIADPKHGLTTAETGAASCKECGKDFPSLRALSGHMRSHSIKNREREVNQCKTCGKQFDSVRAMFGHMKCHSKKSRVGDQSAESLSDLENFCPVRRKRSRIRYKGTTQDVSVSAASDLEEIEEVASCLMMLSRGVKDWLKIDSVVTEFSDDYAVYFGGESSCRSEEFCGNYGDFVCGADKKVNMKTSLSNGKLEYCTFGNANGCSEKNVSGFDDPGPRIVADQDEMEVGFEVAADEKVLVVEDQTTKVDFQVSDDGADDSTKSNSCKKANLGTMKDSETKKKKKSVHKCRTCDKIFHSHRALGGHNAMHKLQEKNGLVPLSVAEADSTDQFDPRETQHEKESCIVSFGSSKTKEHECPICFKVFPSGQALGGHKRAHYTVINESKIQEPSSMADEGSKSMWWAESLVLTN